MTANAVRVAQHRAGAKLRLILEESVEHRELSGLSGRFAAEAAGFPAAARSRVLDDTSGWAPRLR